MFDSKIHRFLFKDHSIRGQHIHLSECWTQMIQDRHYPEAVQTLLGELALVSVMIGNSLKHDGKIILQIQGSGPVNLLLVEVTSELKIRGMAKIKDEIPDEAGLSALLGDGQILLTLENTQTDSHFQSYVPREAETVAECFAQFFEQSDQQTTRLWLTANNQTAGGIILQKMPDHGGSSKEYDEDAWNRINHLTATIKDEELAQLESETLLHRLFHEELVELYPGREVIYECPQDRSRIDAMLKSLGEEEVRDILKEQGKISIHNEICNFHMIYNEEDVNALFSVNDTIQ